MHDYKEEYELVPKCKSKRRRETIIEWGVILLIYSAVILFALFACNPYYFVK